VHSFQGGVDGRSPQATLFVASDGFVYGTTTYDGSGGMGTVFRFDPTNAAASFLTFAGVPGARPWQNEITEGPGGRLYLAASYPSSTALTGQVYEIITGVSPSVRLFADLGYDPEFLGEPVGAVASSRALFVTTTRSYVFPGAVIRYSLADGSRQVIHRFSAGDGGGHDPSSALLLESESIDGSGMRITLVGTTSQGGANFAGTAFRLEVQESPSGLVTASSFQKLADFDRAEEGLGPRTTLVRGSSGEYYGATGAGAIGERGSVFRLGVAAADLDPIVAFARPSPGLPGFTPAALTETADGSAVLGVTWEGGDVGQGTAFTFDPTGTAPPNVVRPFEGVSTQTFGTFSLRASRPVRVGGAYYATLAQGGDHDAGAIVRISPTGSIDTVYSFDGLTEGFRPQELVLGADGRLYGALLYGWAHAGAIFAFDPASPSAIEVLWSYPDVLNGWLEGSHPIGRLAVDADGAVYGTTYEGGPDRDGTVFRLKRTGGTWQHTVLRVLSAVTDGRRPLAGLLFGGDGRLYGSTGGVRYDARSESFGTVFRMNTDGTGFQLLHAFTGDTDSCTPAAALVEAPDGWLYGTANGGYFCQQMPGWWGSLFRVDPRSGAFQTLHTFDRSDGANPLASLLPLTDGSLVGSASFGGPRGGGVLFRIAPSVEDSIAGLIEDVRELIGPPGPLNGGQGNSLIVKLQGALDQLARGQVSVAINKLVAFVNEVEALILSGKLTEGEGRPLILQAQRVIEALS